MTVGTTHGRGASLAARLSRAGVADVPRGERLLTDQALLAVWPQAPEDLPELLGAVAEDLDEPQFAVGERHHQPGAREPRAVPALVPALVLRPAVGERPLPSPCAGCLWRAGRG